MYNQQFSSYGKVLWISAYANLFIQILKRIPTLKEAFTSGEIAAAKKKWTKYLQRKHFLLVKNGKMKLSETKTINQLNWRLDIMMDWLNGTED